MYQITIYRKVSFINNFNYLAPYKIKLNDSVFGVRTNPIFLVGGSMFFIKIYTIV